jgi:SAM-dependent methyltransferase
VYAIDASPAMVNACVARYPAAHVEVGDVRDLSRYDSDQFDAIVAGFNLIDVLNDDERRDVLGEFRRLLAPGGVLVFSTHNRDAPLDRPVDWLRFGPIAVAKLIRNAPRWLPNRRRLRRHEREEATYAIRNDSAHDFGALHYYIARADQERQLAGAGFELIECLDLAGEPVPPNTRSTVAELHYVAR